VEAQTPAWWRRTAESFEQRAEALRNWVRPQLLGAETEMEIELDDARCRAVAGGARRRRTSQSLEAVDRDLDSQQ
jgi:hypothetical protein